MKKTKAIGFILFFFIFLFCSDIFGVIKKQEQPLELINSEEGILVLEIDSPKKKSFQLLLRNPPNAYTKTIEIDDLELTGNNKTIVGTIAQDKRQITFEPNMHERVSVTFDNIPKGNYEGILHFNY